MEGRRLRYSERRQLAETGSLGDLEHDGVPDALRNALEYALDEAFGSPGGARFKEELRRSCVEHFGWNLDSHLVVENAVRHADLDEFLDFLEIVAEEGAQRRSYTMDAGPGRVFSGSGRYKQSFRAVFADFEERFNAWADRHRFGYRLEGGEVRRIGSPALADAIVGPALLAVRREGWEQVERGFKEALEHQRGGVDENDDALTAAHAALESALKAAGLGGDRLATLAKSLRRSQLVPSQLEGVPELLDDLLKRSSSIRDPHSDAHGKAPGARAVPQSLVDLAIHWAGAFIVYLAEVADEART